VRTRAAAAASKLGAAGRLPPLTCLSAGALLSTPWLVCSTRLHLAATRLCAARLRVPLPTNQPASKEAAGACRRARLPGSVYCCCWRQQPVQQRRGPGVFGRPREPGLCCCAARVVRCMRCPANGCAASCIVFALPFDEAWCGGPRGGGAAGLGCACCVRRCVVASGCCWRGGAQRVGPGSSGVGSAQGLAGQQDLCGRHREAPPSKEGRSVVCLRC
jgi:hypothetical protein